MSDFDRVLLESEKKVEAALRQAVREFLRQTRQATLAYIRRTGKTGLTAAVDNLPTGLPDEAWLQTLWENVVKDHVLDALATAYASAWTSGIPGTSVYNYMKAGSQAWLSTVSNRIMYELSPNMAEQAYDAIRVVVGKSISDGWSLNRTVEHLGAVLDWTPDVPFWRREYDRIGKELDAILDQIGPVGDPAREFARQYDPRVNALQEESARYRVAMDRQMSPWEDRAVDIARTMNTGAVNHGHLDSIIAAGFKYKQWKSKQDKRTRETHVNAHNQIVPVLSYFSVGDDSLMYPGDQETASAGEVVRCRCVVVGWPIDEIVESDVYEVF